MGESAPLRLLSEIRLDHQPHHGLLTCNPTVELVAGAAGSKSLHIWRSNGQVVTKNSQRGDRDCVNAVQWRADGQFLAVGWSDGVVRLMGLETAKAVHQMPVCDPSKSEITCIGWTRNLAGTKLSSARSTTSQSWDQLISSGLEAVNKDILRDLPRELTFLEIESALPKLSPLPASGGSGDDMFVFTTRASLEFLFRPFSPKDSDKVDVMIVGTNDGQIHLSIYDSFTVGVFQYTLPASIGPTGPLTLISHTAHSQLSTHALIFKSSLEKNPTSLFLVPMDLTFIHSSPENLSVLASKTTTLQKLLRYTKQVQQHMAHEWQSTRDLPSRFLNSINETLKDAGKYGDMGIGQALYHSVVTGHTFPEVREWLVDQLAERGHKRWDKAVTSGLLTLRGLVHENFLPSLERTGIILSRLLGIARYHESKDGIGFTSAQISKVMEAVSCLMLVGNKILLLCMEELEMFQTFSTWLRHEIDRLASSSTSDDLTEKEATMEHGKVLTYIQQYMPASPLRHYLSGASSSDSDRDWQQADSGGSLLEMLHKQVGKQEAGEDLPSALPQVEFLCKYLESKSNSVFQGIAEAEKRSVRFGQPTKLELQYPISSFDTAQSLACERDGLRGLTFCALTTEQEKSNVYLFRTTTAVVNGISGNPSTQVLRLVLGEGEILDVKFLYEDSLLVLWQGTSSSLTENQPLRLLRIPYRADDFYWTPYTAPISSISSEFSDVYPHTLTNDQVTSTFMSMPIPTTSIAALNPDDPSSSSPGFTAPITHMEIREAASERGRLPARVCLLGADGQTYKVFALPDDPFRGAAIGGAAATTTRKLGEERGQGEDVSMET